MTWMRAVLLCLLGCGACVGLENPTADEEVLEEAEVRLLRVSRYRSRVETPDGRVIANHLVAEATPEAVEFLEEKLLRAPRVAFIHAVYLPNRGGRGGFGGRVSDWVRCTFDNGEMVDLWIMPRFLYLHGQRQVRILITEEETDFLYRPTSWNSIPGSPMQGPEMAKNPWIGRHMGLEDFTLEDSPLMNGEGGFREPISALRYSREDCWCVEDGVTREHDLFLSGVATEGALADLSDLLQESRYVYLLLYPDGRREIPAWRMEEPAEQIRCTLEGGVEITLNYYASEGAWCVEGEDGMRVGRRRNMMGRLLVEEFWSDPPPADGDD